MKLLALAASIVISLTTPVFRQEDAVLIAIPDDNSFYIRKEKVERSDIPKRVSALLKDSRPKSKWFTSSWHCR